MNTTPSSPQHSPSTIDPATTGERALVLGGGGSAGNAWLIGVIAGLSEAGLDVTDADLVVGTSAGSTAAAQLAGATPAELLAAVLAAPVRPAAPPVAPDPGRAPARPAANRDHTDRASAIIAASEDAADLRRGLGAAALEAAAAADFSTRWRTTVAARLPGAAWPRRRMLITAVDARTGDPVVFDRSSGVDLVDAVAASCSARVAYAIGDDRYIDGGHRTNAENADLAVGYARVLVLSPFGGRTLTPPEWGLQLAAQVDALRADGSRVETVFPDGDAREIFAVGGNVMDFATRPPAARAGREQGIALAERLAGFWR